MNLSFEAKEHGRLREFVTALTKKRGQSKKALTEMVNLVMKLVQATERVEKLRTLEMLREVTEGKLFLEARPLSRPNVGRVCPLHTHLLRNAH